MTFTELANEVILRCGEGFQDYVERAKSHLVKNFEELIMGGAVGEQDYAGLIFEYTDGYSAKYKLSDIYAEATLLKIMSVFADTTKLDLLSNSERDNIAGLSDLVGKSYFYREGNFEFINCSSSSSLTFKFVKRFVPATAEENLYDSFTDNFLNKAIDATVETLYREINS
jgi:hypothetical protein